MTSPIYMDYQTTTPIDRAVLEAMLPYFTDQFGDPSSRSHAWGWAAEEAVDRAREQIATLIGAAGPSRDDGRGMVVLVPDRHGAGTNALLLRPPGIIPFAFGRGSRERHVAAARAAGATFEELSGDLTPDVDTPDDLLLAEVATAPAEHG